MSDESEVYKTIRAFLLASFIVASAFFAIMAALVRRTDFITGHTGRFIIEAIVLGVFGSVPVFIIAHGRGSPIGRAARDFGLLFVKFVIFWILSELSGINAYIFPAKR